MKKYFIIIKMSVQGTLQYRFNFFTSVITQLFIWLTFVYLWARIYSEGKTIGDYSLKEMVTYFTITSFISLFINAGLTWRVGDEVKEGELTNYLIKPISYCWNNFSTELGKAIINIAYITPILLVIGFLARDYFMAPAGPFASVLFLGSLALSFLINFLIFYSIGISVFKLNNYSGVFFIWQTIVGFMGGAYIPLNLLPNWLIKLGDFMPFRFISFYPISYYLGRISFGDYAVGLAVAAGWVVVLIMVSKLIWYLGARKYEAYGR